MNAVTAYGVVEVGVHQLWMSALIAGLVGAGFGCKRARCGEG